MSVLFNHHRVLITTSASGVWCNPRSSSWFIAPCFLSSYQGYHFICGVITVLLLHASLNIHLFWISYAIFFFFAQSPTVTRSFYMSSQLVLLLTNLNNLMPSANVGSSQLTPFPGHTEICWTAQTPQASLVTFSPIQELHTFFCPGSWL